ncbi:hypothetical protein G6F31_018127 [Rhizopus arrhizus]|nr:hypothetical protein G6F31_018127 [Rhizopus arrhizus]
MRWPRMTTPPSPASTTPRSTTLLPERNAVVVPDVPPRVDQQPVRAGAVGDERSRPGPARDAAGSALVQPRPVDALRHPAADRAGDRRAPGRFPGAWRGGHGAADHEGSGRGNRHARVHRLAHHHRQIPADPARHLRTEAFLRRAPGRRQRLRPGGQGHGPPPDRRRTGRPAAGR